MDKQILVQGSDYTLALDPTDPKAVLLELANMDFQAGCGTARDFCISRKGWDAGARIEVTIPQAVWVELAAANLSPNPEPGDPMIPLLPVDKVDESLPLIYRLGLAGLATTGWGYSFYEPGVKAGYYEAPGIPSGVVVDSRKTNCTIMCAGQLIVCFPSINWTIDDWADLNVWADPPRPWDSALTCVEEKGLSTRVEEVPDDGTLCLVQGCKTKGVPSHLFWACRNPQSKKLIIYQAASNVGPTWGYAKTSIGENYPGGYAITAFKK